MTELPFWKIELSVQLWYKFRGTNNWPGNKLREKRYIKSKIDNIPDRFNFTLVYIKYITERLKGKNLKFTLKTNGDFDLFGKKLYAIYESGERVSPFYSANEWDGWKIEKVLMKYWL